MVLRSTPKEASISLYFHRTNKRRICYHSFVARRPDLRKFNLGENQIMTRDDLKQYRTNISRLSIDAVRHAYQTAYARCRMVNDRTPSARSIQELVQVWKQLWKWR
jgi:hypothetical protein